MCPTARFVSPVFLPHEASGVFSGSLHPHAVITPAAQCLLESQYPSWIGKNLVRGHFFRGRGACVHSGPLRGEAPRVRYARGWGRAYPPYRAIWGDLLLKLRPGRSVGGLYVWLGWRELAWPGSPYIAQYGFGPCCVSHLLVGALRVAPEALNPGHTHIKTKKKNFP